jgi:sugar phosphate isomerase/epimerase
MNFAICNETFRDWPIDKAFAFAAECGYTGVEVAPFTIATYVTEITPADRAEVRRAAEAAGLEIIGLHWLLARTEGFHVTSPDPVQRRRTADYLGELARCCADLGGKLMVFGSPQQSMWSRAWTMRKTLSRWSCLRWNEPTWSWPWNRWDRRKRTSS